MDQYDKKMAVRLHQQAKRQAVIDHEKKVQNYSLDRSHYNRWELYNRLRFIRWNLSWAKRNNYKVSERQIRWEWQLTYVRLRMCYNSKLPWEANNYCRWV